jgi:glyoxylase-like metal-dependent hydrolase (beta-lactamase superfamily II)
MASEIKTIPLGMVNCYLVKMDGDYVLIDSGYSRNRAELEQKLARSGCRPGNLRLIFITHGDPDHTGNAAYLRKQFGAKIAMNKGDAAMVERGDMTAGRHANAVVKALVGTLSSAFGLKKTDRFKADLYIEDGWNFPGYGFEATAVQTPGHSAGSMSVLTATCFAETCSRIQRNPVSALSTSN